ncbi:MAG: hypothetical protein LKJ05_06065 [Bifidobacteriaceae bacterium]|jgi:hypothetical protein|nr:hypothetical protein [Bifidobacteriaceae bacterium]
MEPTSPSPESQPTPPDPADLGIKRSALIERTTPDPASIAAAEAEEKREHPVRAGFKTSLRVVGFLIAIVSVLLGAVDVVRAVNPSVFLHHGPFVTFLSNLYPVVPAFVCGLVGFILGFGSKILSGSARRSKLTTASILLSILGIVLSGGAFTTTHIFPEGMIHETTQSSAPLNDSEELTQRIDWAFGECDAGWANISPARFPGVSYINVCASTNTLFVAYDNAKQAEAYQGIMANKAIDYIEAARGSKIKDNTFLSLSGDQWLVVGPKTGVKKLHSLWGGTMEAMSSQTKSDDDIADF